MNARRALVTGATGFVGSHLVARLLADGWEVHALVRGQSALDRLGPDARRVQVHRGDDGIDAVRAAMRHARLDVVFHLASLFLSDHEPLDVAHLVESNITFGSLLLEAMSRENVRCLVNAGTSWQHYEGRDYSPVNLYAATKQAFEAILQYYVEATPIRAVTLELSDTYGPGDPRRKIINLLVEAARSGRELVASPGEQEIDLVHVDDVVDAFITGAGKLLSGRVDAHERYSVSSRSAISLRALAVELERALGRKVPVAWGGRPYRAREVMKPIAFAGALPGWQARIPLSLGLKALR